MTVELPGDDDPASKRITGWMFLLGGTAVLLLVAVVAFIWTATGDATETDRDWWGTPTPTVRPGTFPF